MTVGTGNERRAFSRGFNPMTSLHGIHFVKESVENEMVVVVMFFFLRYAGTCSIFFFLHFYQFTLHMNVI